MTGRRLVLIAVGIYALVVGCVMWPGGVATADRDGSRHFQLTNVLAGLPYRGVVMQVQKIDQLEPYVKGIDTIAQTGADTILLVLSARQENGSSSQIYLDMRMSPTPDKLGGLIDYCKSKKLRVALMPIVLLDKPKGNEWRGVLKPESWDEWFDTYRDMIYEFAEVSAAHKVDLFVVGSELVSSEPKLDQWTKTIKGIRDRYKGNLTYSANWDHYAPVPFWDQLDLVGINCYYKLGDNPNVTVDEIDKRWVGIHKNLVDFVTKKDRPLVFLEVGWCSVSNAASDPWDYTKEDLPVDMDLQKRLYQAYFDTWYGDPHLGGFMIWEWPPTPPAEKGYTPEGKPAEEVLKAQFAKKPWVVK